jgi:hypothetical protein
MLFTRLRFPCVIFTQTTSKIKCLRLVNGPELFDFLLGVVKFHDCAVKFYFAFTKDHIAD